MRPLKARAITMPDAAIPPVLAPESSGDVSPVPPAPAAGSPGESAASFSPGGAGAIEQDAQLAEKIERASVAAVEQFLGESKKRPGQRGPDRRPRARRAKAPIPLAPMADGSGPAPGTAAPPEPLEAFEPAPVAFDQEMAGALVDIAVGLLNDGASAIVRAVAKKETGDEKLADEAANAVRMSEKVEACVKRGGLECAKKYSVRLDYAPEFMLGGGLLIWAGRVSMQVRALKAAGVELRQRKEAA